MISENEFTTIRVYLLSALRIIKNIPSSHPSRELGDLSLALEDLERARDLLNKKIDKLVLTGEIE